MTNLEIKIAEEMKRATSEATKYQETLEGLLFDGYILELTVEDRVFRHDEIKEFCGWHAHIYMAGSYEDRVLNCGSDWETEEESIEKICKKELEFQIELSKEEE